MQAPSTNWLQRASQYVAWQRMVNSPAYNLAQSTQGLLFSKARQHGGLLNVPSEAIKPLFGPHFFKAMREFAADTSVAAAIAAGYAAGLFEGVDDGTPGLVPLADMLLVASKYVVAGGEAGLGSRVNGGKAAYQTLERLRAVVERVEYNPTMFLGPVHGNALLGISRRAGVREALAAARQSDKTDDWFLFGAKLGQISFGLGTHSIGTSGFVNEVTLNDLQHLEFLVSSRYRAHSQLPMKVSGNVAALAPLERAISDGSIPAKVTDERERPSEEEEKEANSPQARAQRALDHITRTATASTENAEQHIVNGTGSPSSCADSLSYHALANAMQAWFHQRDLASMRQWCYVAARLQQLAYQISPKVTAGGPRLSALFPVLLANHDGLIEWFTQFEQGFEPKLVEDHKWWDFWAYQAILALRGEWLRLRERSQRVLADPPRSRGIKSTVADHHFYLALALGDVPGMQNALAQLVTPKALRARGAFGYTLTHPFVCEPAVIYAKIAWRHGYHVKVDSDQIPCEWLPNEPLPVYNNHYAFLK